MSLFNSLRAGWRLLLCIGQIAGGMWICAVIFPFLGTEQRMGHIARWSKRMLHVLGIGLRVSGEPPNAGATLIIANHVSWIDILAINAVRPSRFVSKADIRAWPLLGWLIACAGTLFIERERKRDAMRVVHMTADALRTGETVAVFPEGTTSDGHGLLPFHANLLQAAIATETPVQGVALRYSDSRETVSSAAAFIGEQTLAASLWAVLSASRMTAHVRLLPPQATRQLERRALAQRLEGQIGEALAGLPG